MTQVTLITAARQPIGDFDFEDLKTAIDIAEMFAEHDQTDILIVYKDSGKTAKKVKCRNINRC